MTIFIANAIWETRIVIVGLLLALLVSARRAKNHSFFPPSTTTELKGLAILMIIFSHIGYFLVSEHQFLTPLSNYAGVGVDLFLLLSGYGLVATTLKRPLKAGQFYLKRLSRIYIPLIITLIIFLLLDYFFLHRVYPLKTIVENFLGFFPQADIYQNIDSPLWYITPLIIYYLLFPLIFWRRFPIISAIGMACVGWLIIRYIPNFNIISVDLIKLYRLHFLAFPLGMAIAALFNKPPTFVATIVKKFANYSNRLYLFTALRWAIIVLAGGILVYTAHHSRVGEYWTKEITTSLISTTAILIIFLFKKINFKILSLFGAFSFEIYLFHWPLLARYDFLFNKLPAGAATLVYLALFLGLGYLYQAALTKIFSFKKTSDQHMQNDISD